MSFKEIINNLEPLEYKEYYKNLSFEKFMLYAALTLEEKKVPLTFSYLCIATYKLFPEKFCFDEEFKEYPAWERLNRTYMHLKYTPKDKDAYLTWSIENWFTLTEYWREEAKLAKAVITWMMSAPTVRKKKNADNPNRNKQWRWKYTEFLKSRWFQEYEQTWNFDEKLVYSFFWASPYSQKSLIKDQLSMCKDFAENDGNKTCIEYINKFLATL